MKRFTKEQNLYLETGMKILQDRFDELENTNKKLRHLLGDQMIKYFDLLDELDKINNIKELKKLTKKLKDEATKN
jgi:hypothetical protein